MRLILLLSAFLLGNAQLTVAQGSGTPPQQEQKTEKQQAEDDLKSGFTKTETIGEALSFATMGNHQKAMELLEQLSLRYPNDMEVKYQFMNRVINRSNQLVISGNKKEGYRLYKRAANLVRELTSALPPELLVAQRNKHAYLIYNEACAYAMDDENEKCLASLRESIDWGFADVNHLLNDIDLMAVADTEEFKAMLGQRLVNYKAELKEAASNHLENFTSVGFDIQLPDLQGKNVSISDHRGKLVVVTFWATGNSPSRENLKVLSRLHRNHSAGGGIEVVAIACERTDDVNEAVSQLREYLGKNEVPFKCLVGHSKIRGQMKKNQGFPATMLLNKEGRIRVVFAGKVNYYAIETYAELIRQEDAAEDAAEDVVEGNTEDGAKEGTDDGTRDDTDDGSKDGAE